MKLNGMKLNLSGKKNGMNLNLMMNGMKLNSNGKKNGIVQTLKTKTSTKKTLKKISKKDSTNSTKMEET